MKKIFLIFILAYAFTGMAFAGAFGFQKGMTYDQVKEACGGREPEKIKEGIYVIVPLKPHPYFTSYIAWIDEKEGLNYIKAIGADIETNGYGIEVRSKYDDLESAISKTYGKCERMDTLMPDSIWDDPKYWMESIENKERYFFTSWTKESGATLPKDMVGIYMGIYANSSLSGYICLEYEFSNHEAVTKAATEAEDSTL